MPVKICDTCEQNQRYADYAGRMTEDELFFFLRSEVIEQRCRLQWSQNELAKWAQVSRSTVGSFERGDTITLRNFLKISHTLKMYAAWGSFLYNAKFNPAVRQMSHSSKIMQTRPTRSSSKESNASI